VLISKLAVDRHCIFGPLDLFVFDLAVMLYFNKKFQAAAREAAAANKAKTDFFQPCRMISARR
jgi:hypothetical protein